MQLSKQRINEHETSVQVLWKKRDSRVCLRCILRWKGHNSKRSDPSNNCHL